MKQNKINKFSPDQLEKKEEKKQIKITSIESRNIESKNNYEKYEIERNRVNDRWIEEAKD